MSVNISKEELATLIGDKIGGTAIITSAFTTESNKTNKQIEKLTQRVDQLIAKVDTLTDKNKKLKQQLEESIKEDLVNNIPLIITSTGLFSKNLFLLREVMPFGVIEYRRKGPNGEDVYRTDKFIWNHFRLLCDKALTDMGEDPTIKDVFEGCKTNIDSKMMSVMVADIKNNPNNSYDINNETTWAKIDPRIQIEAILKLEADAAPFVPLRACVGFWGADQLLNHFC